MILYSFPKKLKTNKGLKKETLKHADNYKREQVINQRRISCGRGMNHPPVNQSSHGDCSPLFGVHSLSAGEFYTLRWSHPPPRTMCLECIGINLHPKQRQRPTVVRKCGLFLYPSAIAIKLRWVSARIINLLDRGIARYIDRGSGWKKSEDALLWIVQSAMTGC